MNERSQYEQDYYAWTQAQIALLQQRKLDQLDYENLIEELEDLGRAEQREMVNRLTVLLAHLLKWQYQPQKRSRNWEATIRNQRTDIEVLLRRNPSLQAYWSEALSLGYRKGRNEASGETDLPVDTFPEQCPYAIEQIVDETFFPDQQ
jgi:hypothetical protein